MDAGRDGGFAHAFRPAPALTPHRLPDLKSPGGFRYLRDMPPAAVRAAIARLGIAVPADIAAAG